MAEWKPIDDLFDYEKGSLQSSKCTPGKYSFITAAEEWKTHEKFTHDGEALIFAMAASGSLGRTHYVNGKFISSDLCFILTPKKGLRLDLTFYYRLFNFLRADIVKKTATGTSKLAINQTNFGAYKLPFFDYEHQLIFRDKIEKINGISESFSLGLDDQLALLKQLRQSVLQEAIEGKLTAEWRKKNHALISGDNHASKLLEKIKAEKERLIKEGKIKKDKPPLSITNAEKAFELPEGWVWCRLGEIVDIVTKGSSPNWQGIQYVDKDKGIRFITSKNVGSYVIDLTDETFVDKHFNEIEPRSILEKGDILTNIVGASIGRTAIYNMDDLANINQAVCLIRYAHEFVIKMFFLHWMNSSWIIDKMHKDEFAPGRANLSMTNVSNFPFPLPPLVEQQTIVNLVEKLMVMIDELEKQVTERKEQAEMLMQSVLREAFAEEKDNHEGVDLLILLLNAVKLD